MLLDIHQHKLHKVVENLAAYYHDKRHIVFLKGPLGAGKTTLARAWLKAMGIHENIPSPSYAIVQSYHNQHNVVWHHFDCYRLKHANELVLMGMEDYLDDNILCEWPEYAMGDIVLADITITLAFSENTDSRLMDIQVHNKHDEIGIVKLLQGYIKKDQP